MRRLFGVLGILVGIGGLTGIVLEKRAARKMEQRIRALSVRETHPIQPGDRVRIISRAGTFKPEDTGAEDEVVANGQTGVVLRAERPGIVRVRWDAQRWRVWAVRDRSLDLPAFEATIHESYLTIVTPTR